MEDIFEALVEIVSSSGFGLAVAALIGAAGGWFASRASKAERDANTELAEERTHGQEIQNRHAQLDNLEQLWSANIEALEKQISLLKGQVSDLTDEIGYLHVLVRSLEHEIVNLGGDPERVRAEMRAQITQGVLKLD